MTATFRGRHRSILPTDRDGDEDSGSPGGSLSSYVRVENCVRTTLKLQTGSHAGSGCKRSLAS